jgi:hypothetical protein
MGQWVIEKSFLLGTYCRHSIPRIWGYYREEDLELDSQDLLCWSKVLAGYVGGDSLLFTSELFERRWYVYLRG